MPCRAAPREDSDYCPFHDPTLDEIREEARRRGGQNRSNVARALAAMPSPIASTIELVQQSMTDVRDGRLAASRGQAIASLARALVAAWDVHATEARLDELEDELRTVRSTHLRSVS